MCPLDYRVSKQAISRCDTVADLKSYLENLYTGSVAVDFEHVSRKKKGYGFMKNTKK